jgi:hypothetical protein
LLSGSASAGVEVLKRVEDGDVEGVDVDDLPLLFPRRDYEARLHLAQDEAIGLDYEDESCCY